MTKLLAIACCVAAVAAHASGRAASALPMPADRMVRESAHAWSPDRQWEAWIETAEEPHPVPSTWNPDAYPKEGMPLDRARLLVRRRGGPVLEAANLGPGSRFDPRSLYCHAADAVAWSPDSRAIALDYTVRPCESDARNWRYVVMATLGAGVRVMAAADLAAACMAGGVRFEPRDDEYEPFVVGFTSDGRLRIRFEAFDAEDSPPRVRRCRVPASAVREAPRLDGEDRLDP